MPRWLYQNTPKQQTLTSLAADTAEKKAMATTMTSFIV
jgi:hypothetical protein